MLRSILYNIGFLIVHCLTTKLLLAPRNDSTKSIYPTCHSIHLVERGCMHFSSRPAESTPSNLPLSPTCSPTLEPTFGILRKAGI